MNMEEVCNDFSPTLYSSITLNLCPYCCKASAKKFSGRRFVTESSSKNRSESYICVIFLCLTILYVHCGMLSMPSHIWLFFKGRNIRIFKKNNQISQTILLVRQPFKLFSFLTIRVQRTRFCHLKMHLEIECETLVRNVALLIK